MIISAILLIIASGSKALSDLARSGGISHWGPFWDENVAWVMKWKLEVDGEVAHPLRESFPGSSTVFVFVTSGFHLTQFIYLNCLFAAALPFIDWKHVLISRIAFGAVFESTYRAVKKG